jgi:hypothetical protein
MSKCDLRLGQKIAQKGSSILRECKDMLENLSDVVQKYIVALQFVWNADRIVAKHDKSRSSIQKFYL